MRKKTLITGITGQDGGYLARLLLGKGYKVYGAYRRSADPNFSRIKELGIYQDIELVPMDLCDISNITRVLNLIKPNEIYNLAAQSFVGLSFEQPLLTSDINATGVLRMLEAIRSLNLQIKFYQASTSEMFGKVQEIPQTEKTPFYPRSPYGVAKLYAHWMVINYRESYKMFACSGLLYNHESELRGEEFVTKKIVKQAIEIESGKRDVIKLGNMDSKRDWGYAPEYCEAMYLMLQQDKPGNYLIATNETHTIREFVEQTYRLLGYNILWVGKGIEEKGVVDNKVVVEVVPEFFRPCEVDLLIGDYSKAKEKLGWEPKVRFKELVEIMLNYEKKIG